MGVGSKIGEGAVHYWPPTNSFLLLRFLRMCQFWWKSIKKCDRESARRRTDTHTDSKRFYNLFHAICYSYGTDKNMIRLSQSHSMSTSEFQTFPRTRTSFRDRSFAVAGPRLWNTLSSTLRRMTSYGQFRRHLKAHLFRAYRKRFGKTAWM